jgi:hypothetical protein
VVPHTQVVPEHVSPPVQAGVHVDATQVPPVQL